ncbi:MAG TPA: hypothetical protein VJ927_00445 [Actinomycetota bacterium]|nr:hypothetical protein [Actinomycetota bacterium]
MYLAWLLLGTFVALLAGAIYVGSNPPSGEPIRVLDAIWAGSFVGFPVAGAVVVSRIPTRPLGWILLAAPLLLIAGLALGESAREGAGGLPIGSGEWLEWGASVTFSAGIGLILFVPLFLPDGTLPSRRWRVVAWSLGVCVSVWVLSAAFRPGPMEMEMGFANPLGIEALRGFFALAEALLGPVALTSVGLGTVSLVVRFRRSSGQEREQLKWLALGGVIAVACFLLIWSLEAIVGDLSDTVVTIIIIVAILALPASIATAAMRHRLYDVDVVINKTLVYGTLSAILGLSYLAIVVVLQRVFGSLVQGSDIAVAGSTLAVAALFGPVRARIQAFIDRRFYRRKYDAAETLGAFTGRLRDEVDLDALGQDLVAVVGSTMQPAHASLWLRLPDRSQV